MPTNTAERITVVGLPGAGKTVWCEKYAEDYIRRREGVLVVDPIKSFKISRTTIFHTKATTPTDEVEALLKRACIDPFNEKIPLAKRYRLLILDEVSRYYPNGKPLPENIGFINDFNRHMDLSLVSVARRMTQIATDLPELSHRLIIYKQRGINDLKRLEDLAKGLGDACEKLKKHEYLELTAENEIILHKPLDFKRSKPT